MRKGVLQPQDVLINKDGANTGKIGIYEGQFGEAAINEHVFLLRTEDTKLTQRFLYRLLSWELVQCVIHSKISGSAQPGLKSDFARYFPVVVPASTVEQNEIAAVLDLVDATINETATIIAKLEHVQVGFLHNLLTRGLNHNGELRDPERRPEQFFQSEGRMIPRGWRILTLEQIADPANPICYGIVQAFGFVPNGVPVLTIRDIKGDFITNIHRTAKDIDDSYARSHTIPGDVLISIKGTIGRIGLVPPHFHGNISRDLARIRTAENINPLYVCHMLRSPEGQQTLSLAQVGTTRGELSIGPLKKLKFPIPEATEQYEIARRLNQLEEFLSSLWTEHYTLRHIKAGLLDDMLSGAVRVDCDVKVGAA